MDPKDELRSPEHPPGNSIGEMDHPPGNVIEEFSAEERVEETEEQPGS